MMNLPVKIRIYMLLACVCVCLSCDDGSIGCDCKKDPDPSPEPVTVQEISIEMNTALWDDIRHTARSPEILLPVCGAGPAESPFEYVPATVTVDGQTLHDVGVRTKGWWGSINPTRPSLKVEFDEFVDQQRMDDLERITLNNNNQDASRMRTCLAYQMYQKIDYPAPDCGYGHVIVNGRDFGIYSVVEPIKKSFLRKWFDDEDGNLYECQASDFTPDGINRWERKTNKSTAEDRSDIEAIMVALQADDDTLMSRLEPLIDMDKFYTFWAMEILLGNWDGFSGNNNNTYIYNDPTTGKFVFIPWGPDAAFSSSEESPRGINSVGPLLANSVLTNRLYDHPTARQKLKRRLVELNKIIWADDQLLKLVDHIQPALQPYISSKFNPDFISETVALKDFMTIHSKAVAEALAASGNLPEYPFEPERLCYDEFPASKPFSISFSTTWKEPIAPGTGSLTEFIFPGVEFATDVPQFAYSVFAGPTTQKVPGIANVSLSILQFIFSSETTGELYGLSLHLSPHQFLSGESISLENLTTCGLGVYLSDFNDPDAAQIAGIVLNGTLTLTESGMNPGDPVSGTIQGEITGR